ncbi:hypothetical protein ACIPUD_21125 [Bradyrhizobium sp. CAR08]
MAKKPAGPPDSSAPVTVPSDFPAVVPRDLHPTSDIRFVIHELGKLTSQVERLVTDVEGHGKKIGEVKDAITFVKGAIWVVGGVIALLGVVFGLIMSGKVSIAFH